MFVATKTGVKSKYDFLIRLYAVVSRLNLKKSKV